MVFTQEKIKKLDTLLRGKGLIIGHQSPDGDSIGSCVGLSLYLKSIGVDSKVVAPDPFPDFLNWMQGTTDILIFSRQPELVKETVNSCDFIFTLDFNDLSRLGDLGVSIEACGKPIIMIDHHQSPKDYAALMFSDVNCGSTSELICRLIDKRGDNHRLTESIAEALYCGMMTDTGSFRFSSVSSETHRCVARLIDSGLKPYKVHENVFDNQSYDKLRLLGFALSQKMVVRPDLSMAYVTLSSEEAKQFDCKKGDTEGLVNYALSIKGVRVGAFFREDEGKIKISFRSKGKIRVNELADKYFNGGGHINAAGGRFDDTIENAVNLFIEKLPEYLNE
ncbi:MAG: DHH family phosphoesterase [Flavobacteriales bacterium]